MTITSTAATPIPPASVGVKNPLRSPMIMRRNTPSTTATSGRDAILSFHVDLPRQVPDRG
jgi:hypothetical protein